jgi:hypothetical protein
MSNGKGDKPRPLAVPYEQYADNFDNIFRKKPQPAETEQPKPHHDKKRNTRKLLRQ